MSMGTFISKTPEETLELGRAWSLALKGPMVIGLTGDLGAGKTQLVKGLAAGLGITAGVHSPTFALLNEYAGGRLGMIHLDLYRLDSRPQIITAGLAGFLEQPHGLVVVEWAERWSADPLDFGRPFRKARIDVGIDDLRTITYEDFGD